MKKHLSILLTFILLPACLIFAQTATAPATGDGTAGNPYRIASLENLFWLSQNSDQWGSGTFFIQTSNIDASATSGWFSNGTGGYYGFPAIAGYSQSVGGQVGGSFDANYDGQGYSISNLYINRSPHNVALFGSCNDAVIRNMNLLNPTVLVGSNGGSPSYGYSGNAIFMAAGSATLSNIHITNGVLTVNSWHGYIGGMLGRTSNVQADDCSADVIMNCTSTYGGPIGGFVAYSEFSTSVFTNCSSTGSITSNQSPIGGFTGGTYAGSYTYDRCYSSCNVTSTGSSGGFSGETYDGNSIYTDCYAAGNVNGNNSGGFNGFTVAGVSTFTNCYAKGLLTGSGSGGFGGSAGSHNYINCFWDNESSGNANAFGSGNNAGVSGKTTAEMNDPASYTGAGWDFINESENGTNDYWFIQAGYNNGYPSIVSNIRKWTGDSSNVWTDASNWGNNILPDSNSIVMIMPSGSNLPAISSDITVDRFSFNTVNYIPDLGNFNLTCKEVLNYDTSNYIRTSGSGVLKINIPNTLLSIFPVGLSAFNPVAITNNSDDADDFTVRVLDEVYGNGYNGNAVSTSHVKRTWDISKANVNSGAGVNFMFFWNDGETEGAIATPALFHFDSDWEKQTGITNSTANSLSYTGYTGTFSPFSIGDASGTLPLTLLNLTAQKQSQAVIIKWTTVEEYATGNFILQRSNDGIKWDDIAQFASAGTSNTNKYYSYTDNKPFIGFNYYRLVQNDLNGNGSYSRIVSVQFNNISLFTILPNPVTTGSINLYISQAGIVEIFNQSGELLLKKSFAAGTHQVNISRFAKGAYFVKTNAQTLKIMIQ